mgnify:CR=1 FL=1
MIEDNSFAQAIARQKIDTDLKRSTIDIMEDRYEEFFAIKYFDFDNQVLNYMSMPFEYTAELEKAEIELGTLVLKHLGILPREQVKIINDLELQDISQSIMYDPENEEIWSITIKVNCLVEGSFYDENKRSWVLPLGTKIAEFEIEPVKNWKESFDFSNFHEFSIKSMEKMTNYMIMNDEEGTKKIYLPKEKQTIKVNVVQDNWDQVIRVKLVPHENSKKWLTHYICFKTKA